ncbi:MAG TPA: cytidine deaminase [Candidatus Eisenbacteria bacterium]|nr:cytidine deaminase [Candidatus Eisenbacteria bacterium]
MNLQKKKELIAQAIEASQSSYSPYSNYRVGAALLCQDASVYTGCNVENASYGGSICAERTAIVKAVSAGQKEFKALAIYGARADTAIEDNDQYAFPCGICRQFLYEFAQDDLLVLIARNQDDFIQRSMADLLPDNFASVNLKSK